MLSQLADKAAFVNNLPLLTQATTDDEEPTPGFLLDEITKITFQSVSSSHQLVDYLVHRLNKSSTPVKIKVLKIILYVMNHGHTSFRQQLRLHDGSIKNAALHTGPADPLLGNTLYKDVQKLAQDTLNSLFSSEMMRADEGDAFTVIESPPIYMGGMGAAASSSGKYEGFGNSLKGREGTVTHKMLDYLERLIHPSDDQTSEVIRAALHTSPGDYQPVAIAGALIDPVLKAELPTSKVPFVKNHIPGRAGGGWESDEDECKDDSMNHIESGPSKSTDTSYDISNTKGLGDFLPEDKSNFELQEMLNSYCRKSGMPSVKELDEVCARCAAFGFPQVLVNLPTITPAIMPNKTEDGLMRFLLLCEWLYHCDVMAHQLLGAGTTKIVEEILEMSQLSAACKSKAKKLKILYSKSGCAKSEHLN